MGSNEEHYYYSLLTNKRAIYDNAPKIHPCHHDWPYKVLSSPVLANSMHDEKHSIHAITWLEQWSS